MQINDGTADAVLHPVTVQIINQGPGIWGNVATGLITGLLTGCVAFAGIYLTHRLTRQRDYYARQDRLSSERYFIATQLVFTLEMFAEHCAEIAKDTGYEDERGVYRTHLDAPEFNLSGVEGDWRALPNRLVYRIREIAVLQREAALAIYHASEHATLPENEEYFSERRYHYARLGLKAIIQARRLRELAGLPSTRLDEASWSAQPVMWAAWRSERKIRSTWKSYTLSDGGYP